MNTYKTIVIFAGIIFFLAACNKNQNDFDASGSFEAEETIIPAEASGVIKELKIEEGQLLKAGEEVGYIDTIQLSLRKEQLKAQANAVLSRRPDISVQLAALQSQLATAESEKVRITNLVKGGAATQKQLDDINASIDVIKKQVQAQRSSLAITSESITKEVAPLWVQIDQVNDQLEKSRIINPINGTVLTQYARQNEMAAPGKALYKIADLSSIILRAYISGNQLPQVKLNQKVKVLTDTGNGGFKEAEGIVTWINDKAEFTPKTIQTKEERANMVYAIKVKVKNDGSYKIGMYGEIIFL